MQHNFVLQFYIFSQFYLRLGFLLSPSPAEAMTFYDYPKPSISSLRGEPCAIPPSAQPRSLLHLVLLIDSPRHISIICAWGSVQSGQNCTYDLWDEVVTEWGCWGSPVPQHWAFSFQLLFWQEVVFLDKKPGNLPGLLRAGTWVWWGQTAALIMNLFFLSKYAQDLCFSVLLFSLEKLSYNEKVRYKDRGIKDSIHRTYGYHMIQSQGELPEQWHHQELEI